MGLNKISLTFNDKNLEQEYKKYFEERFLLQVKTAMFFGMLLYSIFGFLDYFLYPSFYPLLLAIRFKFVVPIFIILYLLLYFKPFVKNIPIIITVGILVAGFGIIKMIKIIHFYGFENNLYFSGLLLVAFFAYTFFRLKFLYALFSGFLLIIAYEFNAVFITKIPNEALIASNFFLISTNVAGIIVNYIIELDTRKYFLLYRQLKKEKEFLSADNVKLEKLAYIDALTEVPNKRFLFKFIEHYREKKEKTLSLLMIDVDFFKNFNDTYGHIAGDDCLKKIAKVLQREIRKERDIVARFGGEEFVILLNNTDKNGAMEIARRIKEKVKALKIPHKSSLVSKFVTISIGGVSIENAHEENFVSLIKKADEALYMAKNLGRDKVYFYQKLKQSKKEIFC